MNSETKAYSELLAIWRNQPDTPTETPLSRNELDNIFSSIGIKLTPDVVALYSITGGMADGSPDDRMFELWGLERLIRENTKSRWDYCWIADWLISSHLYAVKPIDDEHPLAWFFETTTERDITICCTRIQACARFENGSSFVPAR